MHVSLDSALGRQRRLNSVGESVLQIAPNAAAAYSLRSLTGGDPKVVRVRRGSNNVESDFTASGVSSGALLDFVTTSQIGWNAQPTFSNAAGTGSVTSQSSTATTATVSFTGEASLIRETSKPNHVLGSSGDQVIFNISVSGLDSAGTLRLRTSGTNTTVASSSISNGDNQDITLNLTGSAGYLAMTFVASSGGTITFNSIKVLPKSGFVETWYDQSGNSEDAVQETAGSQPKIVNAGSLVVDSAGLPEIDFDGSNDYLTASSYSRSGEDLPLTMISVFNQDVAGIAYVVALNQTNNNAFDRILLRTDSFDYGRRATDNTAKAGSGSDPDADTKYLFTAINSGTTSSGFVDGSSIFSGVDTNVGTQALNQINIGLNTGDSSANNPFDGKMQEIIIYETDQSDNRPALEANIMTNYGIS